MDSAWHPPWPVVGAACVCVLVADVIFAIVCNFTGLPWGYLIIPGLMMYAAIGVVFVQRYTIGAAAGGIALTALCDMTIGEWIEHLLDAPFASPFMEEGPFMEVLTMRLALSLLTGTALGAGLAWRALWGRRDS